MNRFIFLIPLFPLLGFLFNFVVGVRLLRGRRATDGHGHGHGDDHGHAAAHAHPPALIGWVACGAVLLSFATAVYAVMQAHAAPDHMLVETLWSWLPGGAVETARGAASFSVDWAYQVDALSSVMVLVVTFVGLLIHVYSAFLAPALGAGYMAHDPGYARFMSYLNLFMFAMLTLVLGANYLVLFVGWEGVGLCSYLLIGFWFDKKSASDAGKKAFIVNRIGDAGFALGMFLIFTTFGSLDFRTVMEQAAHLPIDWSWAGPLTLIGLFLFTGACGKSAQIPLYVWLPDAMEGPTPVSALIHAATMVTAGVYMVARSAAIYAHAPKAMMVVAVVGIATAFFAASIGLVQNDIKRVLAYSTVSQLGYMVAACGAGAFSAGVFHLMTHAFFKALLFLGAGSVIHGMSGEQDMRNMGGLREKMPRTHLTMLIGCIAIAGIPPLAGFFSKDEILWSAYRIGGYGRMVWVPGALASLMTAFYMFRLYFMTFGGSFRGTEEQAHHVHESPATMTVPLMVLAAGSVLAGFLGIPAVLGGGNWFEHFLEPVMEGAHHALGEVFTAPVPGHGTELILMAGSVGIALLGSGLAFHFYRNRSQVELPAALRPLHRLLLNKYYVDEAYDALFVRGAALGGGHALHNVDRDVVDGGRGEVRAGLGVNGLAWLTRDVVAKLSNVWDRYAVDGAVNLTAYALDNMSYVLRAVQNGLVQQYALSMLIAVVLLFGGWLLAR